MDIIKSSDLKTILHSKRANIYYLEHCRVLVNGGRVEYVTDEGKQSLYWNIPIANTTVVMLGTGTSVTQAAMREFARAGVMVGFCGGGGTPLYAGNEIDFSWLSPQSEYRPTNWLQLWVSFWFDDEKRLAAAKNFQCIRIEKIQQHWLGARMQRYSYIAQRIAKILISPDSVLSFWTGIMSVPQDIGYLAYDFLDTDSRYIRETERIRMVKAIRYGILKNHKFIKTIEIVFDAFNKYISAEK